MGLCSPIRAIPWRTARVTPIGRAQRPMWPAGRDRPGRSRARARGPGSHARRRPAPPARRPRGRALARCRLRSRRAGGGRRGLGALVEHRTRVPECHRLPRLTGDQVEHVELASGVGEELGEIPDALEVADANGLPVEHHRPLLRPGPEVFSDPRERVGSGERRSPWSNAPTDGPFPARRVNARARIDDKWARSWIRRRSATFALPIAGA